MSGGHRARLEIRLRTAAEDGDWVTAEELARELSYLLEPEEDDRKPKAIQRWGVDA